MTRRRLGPLEHQLSASPPQALVDRWACDDLDDSQTRFCVTQVEAEIKGFSLKRQAP